MTLGFFIYVDESNVAPEEDVPTPVENTLQDIDTTPDNENSLDNDLDSENEVGQKDPVNHNDLITLTNPLPEDVVSSPLTITGEARGQWFFEGSFPITLTNWDGLIIAEGFATSPESWMTTEYIPFSATLDFPEQESGSRGFLILRKDNPSGLPENDDALEVMLFYK